MFYFVLKYLEFDVILVQEECLASTFTSASKFFVELLYASYFYVHLTVM